MSRNNRPGFNEPVEAIVVEVVDPIEDTIEVGEIILVDGPLDAVPLGEGPRDAGEYQAPRSSAGPMPDFGTADKLKDGVKDVTQKAQDTAQGIAGKAQDAAQSVADKAQDVAQGAAGKAKDAASAVADKAQDVAQSVAGKAKDAASTVADKAQDVSQKISDGATSVKASVGAAVPATTSALSKVGSAGASGVSSFGTILWTLIQRNPLQAIAVIASLTWLFRSNKAAASQPPVSVADAAGGAAEKVGTVAGQVKVAASNLGSQVQDQANRGTDWFSRTLQETPLAIGAIAVAIGAGLGLAVPESGYEHQLLGKTRDDLVGTISTQAQDVAQKVVTVAQTAVHEAVEKGKEEAKNQGLTPEALGQAVDQAADQASQKVQGATQAAGQAVAKAAGKVQETAQTVDAAAGQVKDKAQGAGQSQSQSS